MREVIFGPKKFHHLRNESKVRYFYFLAALTFSSVYLCKNLLKEISLHKLMDYNIEA